MGARLLRSGAGAAAIMWGCFAACQANPIPADDAAAQGGADDPRAGQAAGLASPGASSSREAAIIDRRPSLSTDSDKKLLAQERADAMASARDPALIPIDIQGVGAQAHPAPSALPKKQDEVAGGDGDGLKKFALTARDWMHDVFGKPDNAPDSAPDRALPAVPGAGGDLGLPVETQSSGVKPLALRREPPVEMPPPGAGPHRAAAAPVQETAGARLLAESAPEYSIQQALKRCREVLVHPLTWLAVVLVGVTRIAMSRGRR
ncbi:hypothetical protein [Scleromatobacter humisilvae]|uniref:Uncharacterized protein n=1 Tax=Scleromatobacter humisilvae TaxID=2897159 RepID=A0A9X1YIH8_9BURK|nr:hypothetical protein [Scleromatobacter humisilvae]MCK9686337.1 hypothetical protein [Scleromatobacter humisilvae]